MIAEAERLVVATKEKAKEHRPLLEDTAELTANPYDDGPYRPFVVANAPEDVKPLIVDVGILDKAREIVKGGDQALAVTSAATDEAGFVAGQTTVTELANKVAVFRDQLPADRPPLPAVERLGNALKDRVGLLDDSIVAIKAAAAFARQEHDAVVDLLEGHTWTGNEPAETKRMRIQAAYRKTAGELLTAIGSAQRKGPSLDWEPLIETIKAFQTENASPPAQSGNAPDPIDVANHESLTSEATKLKAGFEIWQIDSQERTFTKKVTRLHEILARYNDPQLKPMAADKLEEWMIAGVPAKDKPNFPAGLEEAETEDGVILVGVFEDYKYWKSQEDKLRNPAGYKTINLRGFIRQPGGFLPVMLVEDYQDKYRGALLPNWKLKSQWDHFKQGCSELQVELARYVKPGGGDSGGVTFQTEINFSEEVLSIWIAQIQPLLPP